MKVKKVFKYATGEVIPVGAVYLCTKTETIVEKKTLEEGVVVDFVRNLFVWHYFLVEVEAKS